MPKILFFILFSLSLLKGQNVNSNISESYLEEVKELDLIDVAWQYTHLIHYESNTTLHEADEKYVSLIYFKYDYSAQTRHQGKLTYNSWCLDDRLLTFTYRNIDKFQIVALDDQNLVLEYRKENGNTFQYHFIRKPSKNNLFTKLGNELPIVKVKEKRKRPWWAFWRKEEKINKSDPKPKDVYINVELIGGGFYGGINPVVLDYIKINHKGRLIMEHKTRDGHHTVIKKDISQEELEAFGNWVFRQGFFDLQRAYECTDGNCQKRKKKKPKPIPLRLLIAYGNRSKMVTIDIWGQDHMRQDYLEYPPMIDKIIDAIQRMAHRTK